MLTSSRSLAGRSSLQPALLGELPALVQAALRSSPRQHTSLDCLVALAAAGVQMRGAALSQLTAAAVKALGSLSDRQSAGSLQKVLSALTERMVPLCQTQDDAPALSQAAQAALSVSDPPAQVRCLLVTEVQTSACCRMPEVCC